MDEDGATIGIDALLVEVGGDAIVVLRLVGVHLLALTRVVYHSGIDNLIVILTVFVAGEGGGFYVDIGHLCAGIGLDAKGTQRMEDRALPSLPCTSYTSSNCPRLVVALLSSLLEQEAIATFKPLVRAAAITHDNTLFIPYLIIYSSYSTLFSRHFLVLTAMFFARHSL